LARARGFVYCLARTGVTGGGGGYAGSIEARVGEVRRQSRLPVAVGFGIATGEQARALRGVADAVGVGAALMREVTRDPARGVGARQLSAARFRSEVGAEETLRLPGTRGPQRPSGEATRTGRSSAARSKGPSSTQPSRSTSDFPVAHPRGGALRDPLGCGQPV